MPLNKTVRYHRASGSESTVDERGSNQRRYNRRRTHATVLRNIEKRIDDGQLLLDQPHYRDGHEHAAKTDTGHDRANAKDRGVTGATDDATRAIARDVLEPTLPRLRRSSELCSRCRACPRHLVAASTPG
jgi:hypothetical protein